MRGVEFQGRVGSVLMRVVPFDGSKLVRAAHTCKKRRKKGENKLLLIFAGFGFYDAGGSILIEFFT